MIDVADFEPQFPDMPPNLIKTVKDSVDQLNTKNSNIAIPRELTEYINKSDLRVRYNLIACCIKLIEKIKEFNILTDHDKALLTKFINRLKSIAVQASLLIELIEQNIKAIIDKSISMRWFGLTIFSRYREVLTEVRNVLKQTSGDNLNLTGDHKNPLTDNEIIDNFIQILKQTDILASVSKLRQLKTKYQPKVDIKISDTVSGFRDEVEVSEEDYNKLKGILLQTIQSDVIHTQNEQTIPMRDILISGIASVSGFAYVCGLIGITAYLSTFGPLVAIGIASLSTCIGFTFGLGMLIPILLCMAYVALTHYKPEIQYFITFLLASVRHNYQSMTRSVK